MDSARKGWEMRRSSSESDLLPLKEPKKLDVVGRQFMKCNESSEIWRKDK